jgi:hypothetical protein
VIRLLKRDAANLKSTHELSATGININPAIERSTGDAEKNRTRFHSALRFCICAEALFEWYQVRGHRQLELQYPTGVARNVKLAWIAGLVDQIICTAA